MIGLLLGDGHIQRRSPTGNSRFKFSQTAVEHKEYFNHVLGYFRTYCVKGNDYIPQYKTFIDKRTKAVYNSLNLTTMQLPCFNVYREMFYPDNVKIIPNNISELLTPRGLAHWIMDDGSRQGKGLHLSVYAYTTEDVDKLMLTLQDKFNLKCSIHYNRDHKPRIYIFMESMGHLRTIVKGYFIKEMLYKLGL